MIASPQIVGTTITAVPSSVADADDEANVAAVDAAFVDIAGQPQISGSPQIPGVPLCLVLRANIGVLHGIVEGITYQVTVVSNFREGEPAKRQLQSNAVPTD